MQRVNFLVTCLEPMKKPTCRETVNDPRLGSARARCVLCSGHGSLHDRLVDRVSLRSTACSGAFSVNRTFTATNDQCHTQEARGYEQKIYLAFSVPYWSRFGTPSLQTSLREQSKHFVVAPAKRKLRHTVACSEPLSDHPRRPFYRFHAPSWYGPLRHFPPGPVHPMDMYGRPSSLSLDEDRKIRPGIKGDSDFDVAMRYCERQPLAPMRVLADALEKAPDTQRIAEWPRDLLWVEYSTDHTQVHLVQPPSDPTVSKCITVLQFFTTENTDCWFGNRFWRNSMLTFREFPAIRFIRIFSGKYETERRASGTELGAERCANESDTHPIRPDWQRIMTALERERLGGLVAIDSERLDFFRAVGAIGWPFYVVLAPTGTVLAKWYQGSPCGGPSMDEENGHILLLDIVLAGAMDYYANELCSTLPPGRFSLLPDFRKPPSFDVPPTTPTGRVFSSHREGPQTVPRSTTNELPRLRYPTKSIIVRRREPLGPTEHSETPGIQLPSRAADPATCQWHAYLVVADTNNDRIVWCRLNEARAAPQPDLHHWGTVEGLSSPRGLCYDSSRDLVYIADTGHHRICRFRIPPASERCGSSWFVAEWVAGTGVAKFDLFGTRKAREQSLAFPWDVVMGPVVPPPAPSTPLETKDAGSPANKPRSVASEALYITNAGLNQIWRVDFFAPRNESELLNPGPRSCRAVCGSGDHRQLDISVEDDQRWHIEPVRALCFVSGLAQPSGLTLVPGNREGHESGEGPFLVFVDSESSSVRFYALGPRTTLYPSRRRICFRRYR
ncbi:hypothetical protein F1559_002031 [Cyanidiococcus yangmingshanensis]|uniref:Uncharacterized protein n=1 Tax=Cyanidiococcus yangmingshanensis TaxID=2690220 RepID=A0A7J7IEV8_9RHOD|nr:hypothetical protein F1559_002031 [Cyanidiococcus yangmingshanensis]